MCVCVPIENPIAYCLLGSVCAHNMSYNENKKIYEIYRVACETLHYSLQGTLYFRL